MEKYAPFVSYSPEVPPHECFITPEQIDPAIKNLIISDCSRFRDQTKELLQPDQTEKFLDFLKGNLPRDLYESLKNIETKDLANIIAAIIL